MQTIVDLRNVYLKKVKYAGESFITRRREAVLMRSAFMSACRNVFTTEVIGRAFDKNHSTVIHACKNHFPNSKFFPEYRSYYNEASALVENFIKETTLDPRFKPAASLRMEVAHLHIHSLEMQKEITRLRLLVEKLAEKLGSELEA